MKILNNNWLIFDDEIPLAQKLSEKILSIAKESILKKNCFNIVLTGGQSVLNLYRILSKSDSIWDKWHIYIGDERFLPIEHKDRNYRIINEIWLNSSLIPKKNIHFIRPELGLLEAQKEYEKILNRIDKFDVVLLSMGEDGHVASLFLNHSHPEDQMVIIENNSPKSPRQRVSMSYKQLNKSSYIFKLVVGESKQKAVSLLQQNTNLPISKVKGECEELYICKNAIY